MAELKEFKGKNSEAFRIIKDPAYILISKKSKKLV